MATRWTVWAGVLAAGLALQACGGTDDPSDPGPVDGGRDLAADVATDSGPEELPPPADEGADALPEAIDPDAGDAHPPDDADAGADAPPDLGPLCRPCMSDTECAVDGFEDAFCLTWGDTGSFCAFPCDGTTPCPGGYDCVKVGDQPSGCVPADDAPCPCLPAFEGVVTACTVANDAGRCPGLRTCDQECPAATPAAESCNGKDDDCNGFTDDGLGETTCGTGACVHAAAACWKGRTLECDPLEGATPEKCNGIDDDCDGDTDEDGAGLCVEFYADRDADGIGRTDDSRCLCAAVAPWTAATSGDCNDDDPDVRPGVTEACNGRDDDCNSMTDEAGATGCEPRYADRDGDDFGAGGQLCVCGVVAPYTATVAGDCDDLEPNRYPGRLEVCNGTDDDCNGIKDDIPPVQCENKNGFGTCLGTASCTLGKPSCDGPVPAPESCGNNQDDDCDGATDEAYSAGCLAHYRDNDVDGWGKPGDSRCLCKPAKPFLTLTPGDCNDEDADVKPDGVEDCDGKDNDCNGSVDPEGSVDCQDRWVDGDNDGFGVGDPRCLCAADGAYKAQASGDCQDQEAAINPGETEVCNGIDDDCEGTADVPGTAGCVPYWTDVDGDGYGVGDPTCLCGPDADLRATKNGDCDDALDFAHPGAPDVCGNGIDDNCSGAVDEPGCSGCILYYEDPDGDHYGIGDPVCLSAPDATHTATMAGDCDETETKVNPGMPELCLNGVDDDCSGLIDEPGAQGCRLTYPDADGDGFGARGRSLCLCHPEGEYKVTTGGDCDDTNGGVNPSQAEVCNSLDDDCNGVVDDQGATGCTFLKRDGDGDGYGVAADQKCLCTAAFPYSATKVEDCNDGNPSVHPTATETCDGLDNDCDTTVDPLGSAGCVDRYYDNDNDGWGVGTTKQCACPSQRPWSAGETGDCNDNDSSVYPSRPELCNGVDDNCNGQIDEDGASGCTQVWRDADGDSYGDANQPSCRCQAAGGWVANALDCDDSRSASRPGAPELCNGLDDNCNSVVDDPDAQGCTTWLKDADADGAGVPTLTQCLCAPVAPYTATAGTAADCDDANPDVRPGKTEVCNDVDDNCDGMTDPAGTTGCVNYWEDADADTYGKNTDLPQCLCRSAGTRTATRSGDCNDANANVNPGKSEVCANGLDDNCSGGQDEGC